MGISSFKVEAVDGIRWRRKSIGSSPVAVKRMAQAEGVLVIELADGTFYTPSAKLGKFSYVPSDWPWGKPLVQCLIRLGVITKEQGDAYLKECSDRAARDELRYDSDALKRLEKRYGSARKLKQSAKKSGII